MCKTALPAFQPQLYYLGKIKVLYCTFDLTQAKQNSAYNLIYKMTNYSQLRALEKKEILRKSDNCMGI